mgnify:CR=1 FL=1
MKKIFSLTLVFLLLLGCQNTTPTNETLEEIPSTDYAPEIDELLTDISQIDPSTLTVSGNSELASDATYGFTYSAENAIDQDFSTAWCPTNDFRTQRWRIQFEETVLSGTVGIQNGFARDQEIFFENNRIKTAYLYYDGDNFMETLEFEDTYEMQFFDLPEVPLRELDLHIIDTYPGSKYNDTCISEIDFWSDYVHDKDAEAAHLYYIDNKASDAIQPEDSSKIMIVPADSLSYCGAFDTNLYTKERDTYRSVQENEWGYHGVFGENTNEYSTTEWWLEAGMHAAVSVEMSSDVTVKDKFTLRWWKAPLNMETGEREWSIYHEAPVYPQACDNGELYLSMDQPKAELPGPFADYMVEIIFYGDVIGSTSFNFVQ